MAKNLQSITFYFAQDVKDELQQLSKLTSVPQSVYMREALDDFLEKKRQENKNGKALKKVKS